MSGGVFCLSGHRLKTHNYYETTLMIIMRKKGGIIMEKKLKTGTNVETWSYSDSVYEGISIGASAKANEKVNAIVSVESILCSDGIMRNQIVINKEMAEKFGFNITVA